MHHKTHLEIEIEQHAPGVPTYKEIAVDVIYAIHKGRPGRTYGPPEDCYEAEPAWVEIECVRDGSADITDKLRDKQITNLQQEIEDMLQAKAEADECDHADYVRNARRYEFWERRM